MANRVNAYTSDMDFHVGNVFSKPTYLIKTILIHTRIVKSVWAVISSNAQKVSIFTVS